MTKKNKGRPVYPQIYIGGMSEESRLNILKALAEEEKRAKAKITTHA